MDTFWGDFDEDVEREIADVVEEMEASESAALSDGLKERGASESATLNEGRETRVDFLEVVEEIELEPSESAALSGARVDFPYVGSLLDLWIVMRK